MDPLSITAAVISFVDIVRRIKDSVDKVGQNRQILKELMEDVIEELMVLQKLCEDEQGRLSHLDPEWTHSLERLKSDLMHVLDRCLKLTERRKAHHVLSSAMTFFTAWSKNSEIESHIYRLRDRVSSVHRRFNYVSSSRVERTENRLLVASSEHSVMLGRLGSAMSQLLIKSHANGTFPASLLDNATWGGIEFKYLHQQVQETAALLGGVSSHIFTIEEARGPMSFGCYPGPSWPSQASLMRSTTIQVLQTLQLLESAPSHLALWEGAQCLVDVGNYLSDLGLEKDAAVIFIETTNIYQRLMQRNPSTYLPYVAWGLRSLARIHYGTPEGLDTAERAVHICREVAAISLEDYCVDLAHSLSTYSEHLAADGQFDSALTYATESLAMQRKAPTPQQGQDCLLVSWEASRDEHVALSSTRTISRPYQMAVDDMSSLWAYGNALALVGQWPEALIIATEVVNCLDALVTCDPCRADVSRWLMESHEMRQYLMSRTCPPGPPLSASISDFDDPGKLGNGDTSGEGPDVQSVALMRAQVL
ncbi:hypothetical protein AB1N83_012088 [Pleurotus pulmonarius]|nr:hypothetical protein EYR38_003686 [Pleurotus pulmonarius]